VKVVADDPGVRQRGADRLAVAVVGSIETTSIPARISPGSAESQRSTVRRSRPSSTSITQRRSRSETTVARS
jgi:hypothetical protein